MTTTLFSPLIEISPGPKIQGRWGTWYRHDKVLVNGKELEGFIQVRRRYFGKRIGHRMETITCYSNACVIGQDIAWLRKMNETPGTLLEKATA